MEEIMKAGANAGIDDEKLAKLREELERTMREKLAALAAKEE